MAKSRRSTNRFSGNHQRSWLWGYHAVCETLAAGTWPVLELLVTQSAYDRAGELLDSKARDGISLAIVTAERITELSKAPDHQGFLARLGPFPYLNLDSFVHAIQGEATASLPTASPPPLVVLCDRLQDSFNLGAILRCCDGVGARGVIVGDKSQSEITSHVSRSSAGAVNYLPIVRTNDLVQAALRLKSIGFQVMAADANVATSLWGTNLRGPALLIIGSEAHGVAPDLLSICDQRLFIPMQGRVSSLNAAVAAGIILYEIRRQNAVDHNFRRG